MSINGRLNVDALVHDATTGSMKVLDLDSSESIGTKAALVTGTATAGGLAVDPEDTGYLDSSGNEVTFTSVSVIVVFSNSETSSVRVMGQLTSVHAAAGKCAVAYLPATHGSSDFTVIGDDAFSLLMIGE
tara:strand:- start:1071 stop:1460 length:390 start_codon:yes stop_codon:yes gene_type:complete